ncbi:MAG TPA: TIGR01777 family oxidoreductase [Vicinamibacterales bacterium]|jgi:hypothetical protein|nr:TIGR01777 family oxidoreductase [Vicinamibacterales bacterium]
MNIVIAGGTGFLGGALVATLARDGHDVVVLTRRARGGPANAACAYVGWTPNGETGPWASAVDGAGAVVNLAGESIAGKRWSAAHKQRVLDSRVQATRSLSAAIRGAANPPPVFVSGSAVGYYGPLGDQPVTEDAPAGSDFLARVCVEWEREAASAASARTRLVSVRTGLVLEKDGGALPEMLPPFKFGVGGPVGSGRQYWPWIHRDDWVALVRWAIATPAVSGPVNATAPNPVTNAEFARALGRALHRPAFMPAPGFALRLLLGEMADALLLSGQRAIPAKAARSGFTFKYSNVDEALRAIFT